MNPVAKLLVFAGILLVAVGLLWQVVSRFLPLGRLPGDVVVQRENFRFYFPLVTCIVLSVLLTLVLWLWQASRR